MARLELRNPHSVQAVLKSRPHDLIELQLSANAEGLWVKLAEEAHQRQISVIQTRSGGGRRRGGQQQKSAREGGSLAVIKPKPPTPLKEMFRDVDPHGRGLWLALDRLQDPHNVGAVIRTAGFFGVKGIISLKDQAAPLSGTVYDVASGGMECVPLAVEANLVRVIEVAQQAGLWVLGSSEHAERDYREVDRERPWLLIVGNEEKGLRRLTLEKCDEVCVIPQQGEVDSLNVSVATGVLMSWFG